MKKLLAIISIIIVILAGTTIYQFVKKDKYNLKNGLFDTGRTDKDSFKGLSLSISKTKLYLSFFTN